MGKLIKDFKIIYLPIMVDTVDLELEACFFSDNLGLFSGERDPDVDL